MRICRLMHEAERRASRAATRMMEQLFLLWPEFEIDSLTTAPWKRARPLGCRALFIPIGCSQMIRLAAAITIPVTKAA